MKDSFILYTDQSAVIDKLTDEQAGKLIKAIYHYAADGKEPELETLLDLVFTPIKTVMDKDTQKWAETREKRSEAGKKHTGNQYGQQEQIGTNEPSVPNSEQMEQDGTNGSVNVNVNVNDKYIYPVDEPTGNTTEENFRHDFEILWSKYPRKEGKAKAYQHYKSWMKGKRLSFGGIKKLTNEQMLFAIEEYKKALYQRGTTELKYMKMGDTFFNSAILDYLPKEDDGFG